MASAGPPLDMNDSLLKCAICLNLIKEPKLLSCLHRFCSDCLKGLTNHDISKIECPECRLIHHLPVNGVDGLQTDIGMVNILQINRLQKFILSDTRRNCATCQSRLKLSAFCFKCNLFLCQNCFDNHVSTSDSRQHQPYTLVLREDTMTKLRVEGVASLTDIARCPGHPEHLLEICCNTCHSNEPLCKYCPLGDHQGHDFREIQQLASDERKRLFQKMDGLLNHNKKLKEIRASLMEADGNLNSVFEKRKIRAQDEFDQKEIIIKRKIHSEVKKVDRNKVQIEDILQLGETSIKKRELERQITKLTDEYDTICQEEKRELDIALEVLQEENEMYQGELFDQLVTLKTELKTTIGDLQRKVTCRKQEIQSTSDFCDQMESRLKNIQATISEQLAMHNDWVDVQSIPTIRFGIEAFARDMNRNFPDLKNLSHIRIESSESAEKKLDVGISREAEQVIELEASLGNNWGINCISGNGDGTIVVTGEATKYYSHITVLSQDGEILHQYEFTSDFEIVCRYCEFLTQSKLVTVCWNTEIGMFDVRDGAYVMTNLRDEISSWSPGLDVSCVAVDTVNTDIFIGAKNSRDVYVLDDQLSYSHVLRLPANVRWPRDIAVHGSNLIVCDRAGMEAYIIDLAGPECKQILKFAKPEIHSSDCWPIGVCTDQFGLIYLLWSSIANASWKRALVQYSYDGTDLQTTRLLDDDAWCISKVGTKKGDMLLVSTWKSGKIFQYRLRQDSTIF